MVGTDLEYSQRLIASPGPPHFSIQSGLCRNRARHPRDAEGVGAGEGVLREVVIARQAGPGFETETGLLADEETRPSGGILDPVERPAAGGAVAVADQEGAAHE